MKRGGAVDYLQPVEKHSKTIEVKMDDSGDQVAAFVKPNVDRPDEETQRYDRQLRLWENLGQRRLRDSDLLLFSTSAIATSCQIAKNLVLSGLGRILLFQPGNVNQSDIGNNFFLDQTSLGKPRAEECAKLLQELNRSCLIEPEEDTLPCDHTPYMFDHGYLANGIAAATLALSVGVSESSEEELSCISWDNNRPAIFIQTCGFVASIRVQFQEIGVIDTHPESLVDLRLDCPFPSMVEFVKSFRMDSIDNHDHAHIPAVVIIIHFLEIYRSQNDGKLPQNSADRQKLKEMIMAEKRNGDEDNFDEAVGLIWKACQETKVPSHIQELFNDPHCDKPPDFPDDEREQFTKTFWLFVKALRSFVEQNPIHQLPLSGVLPDMKSDTKNYVQMQSIYRQKAQEDLQTFKDILDKLKAEQEYETDEPVEIFVKNCAHLRLLRGRSLQEERESPIDLIPRFLNECEPENEEYTVTWYIAFRALALYRKKNKAIYPGVREGLLNEDFEELSQIALDYLKKFGWGETSKIPIKLENALKEMVRSGGSELPQISSLIGGLASQEIIKLMTRQYIPLNGTCIFDGYRSATGVVNF